MTDLTERFPPTAAGAVHASDAVAHACARGWRVRGDWATPGRTCACNTCSTACATTSSRWPSSPSSRIGKSESSAPPSSPTTATASATPARAAPRCARPSCAVAEGGARPSCVCCRSTRPRGNAGERAQALSRRMDRDRARRLVDAPGRARARGQTERSRSPKRQALGFRGMPQGRRHPSRAEGRIEIPAGAMPSSRFRIPCSRAGPGGARRRASMRSARPESPCRCCQECARGAVHPRRRHRRHPNDLAVWRNYVQAGSGASAGAWSCSARSTGCGTVRATARIEAEIGLNQVDLGRHSLGVRPRRSVPSVGAKGLVARIRATIFPARAATVCPQLERALAEAYCPPSRRSCAGHLARVRRGRRHHAQPARGAPGRLRTAPGTYRPARQNQSVIEYMMRKIRSERRFEQGLQKYYAVRTVATDLANNLFAHGAGRSARRDLQRARRCSNPAHARVSTTPCKVLFPQPAWQPAVLD